MYANPVIKGRIDPFGIEPLIPPFVIDPMIDTFYVSIIGSAFYENIYIFKNSILCCYFSSILILYVSCLELLLTRETKL